MAEAGQVMRDSPVHREGCFAPPLREERTCHLDPERREAPSRSENKRKTARRTYTHTSLSVSSDLRAHIQTTINLCIPPVKRPCSCRAKPVTSPRIRYANRILSCFRDPKNVRDSLFPAGRRSHPYLVRAGATDRDSGHAVGLNPHVDPKARLTTPGPLCVGREIGIRRSPQPLVYP